MRSEKKIKSVSYAKWGYIFILPFFLTYAVFSVIPLVDTIRNSFYEYYYSGLKAIGPNWVGLANYMELLAADLPKYAWNTFVMWILGFVPQIVVALVLVYRRPAEDPGQAVFQGGHLSAQPDYGLRFRHAVLCPVLQLRPCQ